MIEILIPFFSAMVLGLLGSLHCVGMCGGIIGLLSLKANGSHLALRLMAYNLGRISTYTLIGFIGGFLWSSVTSISPQLILITRILAGGLIVATGLYIGGWWFGIKKIETVGQIFWQPLQPLSKKFFPATTITKCLLLGSLWGWLPCGLVYSALSFASLSHSALEGAVKMLCFGLGTLPAVFATGLTATKLQAFLKLHSVRFYLGLLIVGFGIWVGLGPFLHIN